VGKVSSASAKSVACNVALGGVCVVCGGYFGEDPQDSPGVGAVLFRWMGFGEKFADLLDRAFASISSLLLVSFSF
jgi:hypothetical protein